MITEPLVSVVMPVYNAERFIKEAIDSILSQTYASIELILVVDAPTDRTVEVINAYTDLRLKIFYNEKNRGISYSTNRGIDAATGKYIAFMDDDDISPADRISTEVDFLEGHPEYDIVGGAHCQMDEQGNDLTFPIEQKRNPKYIKAYYLFGEVGIYNGTMMVRRDFLNKYAIRCRENCYGMQDLQFYMECSKYGDITTLRKLFLRHRLHDSNACETGMLKHPEERRKAYARFQRESLERSGYELEDTQIGFINKVITEFGNDCCGSMDEFIQLQDIFCEILQQGRNMNIDYYDELKLVCKKVLAQQIYKMNII